MSEPIREQLASEVEWAKGFVGNWLEDDAHNFVIPADEWGIDLLAALRTLLNSLSPVGETEAASDGVTRLWAWENDCGEVRYAPDRTEKSARALAAAYNGRACYRLPDDPGNEWRYVDAEAAKLPLDPMPFYGPQEGERWPSNSNGVSRFMPRRIFSQNPEDYR